MKFKVGDKVIVREGLIANNRYNENCRFAPEMEAYIGKEFIVKEAESLRVGNRYRLEGVTDYYFSDDMLEPAEFTIYDLQVNDIVTIRKGSMYKIHKFDEELIGVNNDAFIKFGDYKQDFKDKDGYTPVDIICVRRPEEPWQLELEHWGKAPIVWEEKREAYAGKSFERLFKHQWNWLANNPNKNKKDWFDEFYPNEERPTDNCFACQSVIHDGIIECEKCPICDWKGVGCLNGLYDAWWLARCKEEPGIASNIARAIANLKWEEK